MVTEPFAWLVDLPLPLPFPSGLGVLDGPGSSVLSRGLLVLLEELDDGNGCSKCITSGWSIAFANTRSTGRPAAVS